MLSAVNGDPSWAGIFLEWFAPSLRLRRLPSAPWRTAVRPATPELAALAQLRGQVTGQIVWESNRDGSWQLYTMNADGTGARRLTAGPGDFTQATFSRDGTHVLHTRTVPGQPPEVWVMQTDGTGARLVARNALDAVWRNGDRTVQFLRQQRGKELYETCEADLSTGKERLLFPAPGVSYGPQVFGGPGNDDGSRFVVWSPKPRGTWVVSADGSVQAHVHGGCEGQVAQDQRYGYGVFAAGRFVRFNMADGGDMTTVLEGQGASPPHTYFPRVSGDAKWLVYGGCPADRHDYHDTSDYELHIVRLVDWKAEGTPVRLTFNDRTDRWPDVWLAPEGEGNPLTGSDGYDVAGNPATTAPAPMWLWSFTSEDATPELGGDWGLWPQQDGCEGTATFLADLDAEGRPGGAMEVAYTIGAEPRSFALWSTSGARAVDITAYDRFVVYARGTVPSLTLVVKDRTAGDPDAPGGIADYVVTGLTKRWQRFEIPFAAMRPRERDGRIDWSAINHIGFAMIAPQKRNAAPSR